MNLRSILARLAKIVDLTPKPNPPGSDPHGCEPGERCDLAIPGAVVVADCDRTGEEAADWIPERDDRFDVVGEPSTD
jgi:hypothetical protein